MRIVPEPFEVTTLNRYLPAPEFPTCKNALLAEPAGAGIPVDGVTSTQSVSSVSDGFGMFVAHKVTADVGVPVQTKWAAHTSAESTEIGSEYSVASVVLLIVRPSLGE
jgi:hypothetical protein